MALPIPRPVHGVLDYLYAAATAATPHLLGFAEVAPARWAAYGLGALVVVVSLLTRYELGLVRVLPFRVHLLFDFLGGAAALAAPWALGFSDQATARNTFLAIGVVTFLVAGLTQRDEMPTGRVVASE